MKLFDINLFRFIFAENPKNENLEKFLEDIYNCHFSEEEKTRTVEKSSLLEKQKELLNNYDSGDKRFFILELENNLSKVLAKMEYEWVNIDKDLLVNIWREIDWRTNFLENQIWTLAWERYNINSNQQTQVILFEKLWIKPLKKIKTWFSVDNETLEELWKTHDIALFILEFRHLKKLLNTYIEWLQKAINPKNWRIHTTYNQLWTSTGRLSSENPNLQNIPFGDKYSDAIKSSFIPTNSSFEFMVADYSQVELRLLAFLSWDQNLIETFEKWEDIHTRTAMYIFNTTEITKDQRKKAKAVNFWIIYGITAFWLSKNINDNPANCKKYIDTFYEMYPEIRKYYDNIIENAKKNLYVETYFWRRRYIKSINDRNRNIAEAAVREAINMPIQWTCADIIKIAMIEIDNFLTQNNYKTKLIMQVHDELVFELHKDEKEKLVPILKDMMENIPWFPHKLIVDVWFWNNWKEAK